MSFEKQNSRQLKVLVLYCYELLERKLLIVYKNEKEKHSIIKLSIGAASVIVGGLMYGVLGNDEAQANEDVTETTGRNSVTTQASEQHLQVEAVPQEGNNVNVSAVKVPTNTATQAQEDVASVYPMLKHMLMMHYKHKKVVILMVFLQNSSRRQLMRILKQLRQLNLIVKQHISLKTRISKNPYHLAAKKMRLCFSSNKLKPKML